MNDYNLYLEQAMGYLLLVAEVVHMGAVLMGVIFSFIAFIGVYAGVWLGVLSLLMWPISYFLLRRLRKKNKIGAK